MRVIWSPSATTSLAEQIDYYKSQGALPFVRKVVDKIDDIIELLRKWPESGFVFYDNGIVVYRKIQITRSLLLIYRVSNDELRILHVIDLRNQPEIDRFIDGV